MRNPPNYGSITKLKGNRRRPFMVRITTGTVVNYEKKTSYNKQIVLGYYATRKDAAQALAEYNASKISPDSLDVTIRQIWNRIKDKIDVSDDRRKNYEASFRNYLEPIADRRIADVKTGTIQDLLDGIGRGSGTQTIARTVLNHIYTYAAQNDIIRQNYVDYVHIKTDEVKIERKTYTPDEVALCWKNKDTPEYAFTLVLLYEGMRIKELRDIKKSAVDLKAGTLTIVEGKNATSRRVIPIHAKVFPIIAENMKTDGEALFTFSKWKYERFIARTFEHRPYDTRHTFASKANEIGIPKLTIQRIMGHKPDTILEQAYIHLKISDIKNELDKVDYM